MFKDKFTKLGKLTGTKLGKLNGTNDTSHETEPSTFTGSLAKSSHSFIWSASWARHASRSLSLFLPGLRFIVISIQVFVISMCEKIWAKWS